MTLCHLSVCLGLWAAMTRQLPRTMLVVSGIVLLTLLLCFIYRFYEARRAERSLVPKDCQTRDCQQLLVPKKSDKLRRRQRNNLQNCQVRGSQPRGHRLTESDGGHYTRLFLDCSIVFICTLLSA